MKKNLLALNGKLDPEEWDWLAKMLVWDRHNFGPTLQKHVSGLLPGPEESITREQILLLDFEQVWKMATKCISFTPVSEAERKVYRKLWAFKYEEKENDS